MEIWWRRDRSNTEGERREGKERSVDGYTRVCVLSMLFMSVQIHIVQVRQIY